jgi:nicotinamidase-related amidase
MGYAFIIIDMQEDFFKDNFILNQKKSSLIKKINELINICRISKTPLIWVTQEFEEDLSDAFLVMRENNIHKTIIGTEGCKILNDLNKNTNDLSIIKKRYSAFYKTSLEENLQALNIDTLILAGINTHACIRMAAVDAYQRDYKVILARECMDSYDEAFQNESLRYLTGYISKALFNKDIQEILISNK